DLIGRTIATRKLDDIQELLPGNHATFHEKLHGVGAWVRLGTDVELTPVAVSGTGDEAPQASTTGVHTWAIPWTVILLIVLGWLLFRRYRRAGARSGPAPQAPGNGRRPVGPGPGPGPALPEGSRRPGPAPEPERVPVCGGPSRSAGG